MSIDGYSFRRDPAFLTRWIKALLWILIGIDLLRLLPDFVLLGLFLIHTVSEENTDISRRIELGLSFFYGLVNINAVFCFLKWIYRANLNARGFGARLHYTPGWAIGCYFVPIACFYQPYLAMKEIWQASINPGDWSDQTTPGLLRCWWALSLTVNIFFPLTYLILSYFCNLRLLPTSAIIEIFINLFDIGLCLAAFFVISAIYRQQKKLVDGA
jgi:hypothetical protein